MTKSKNATMFDKPTLQSLPKEIRTEIWSFVFANAKIYLKSFVDAIKAPCGDEIVLYERRSAWSRAHLNEEDFCDEDIPVEPMTLVNVFTNTHLEDFADISSFEQFREEVEHAFFNNVVLDVSGCDSRTGRGRETELLKADMIRNVSDYSLCLSEPNNRNCVRTLWPSVKDYTKANEHAVVLPDFPNLKHISVSNHCWYFASQPFANYRWTDLVKLLHLKKSFTVSFSLQILAMDKDQVQSEVGHAFAVDNKKLKFEYAVNKYKKCAWFTDSERRLRDQLGIWEKGSVRNTAYLKAAIEDVMYEDDESEDE